MFKLPISRKVIYQAIVGALAGLIGAGLNAVGVYSVPADVQGLISSAEVVAAGYAAGWATTEGVTYANYLLQKLGLGKAVEVDPTP